MNRDNNIIAFRDKKAQSPLSKIKGSTQKLVDSQFSGRYVRQAGEKVGVMA